MKHKFSLIVVIITVAICAAIYAISVNRGEKEKYIPVYEYTPLSIELTSDVEEVEEYIIPKDEWYLKVVNKKNPIDATYPLTVKPVGTNGYYFDERAIDALTAMLDAGTQAGMSFRISSAYRSIDRQAALYQQRVNELLASGFTQADAESIAATQTSPPGTSEHNLGLGADIIATNTRVMDETYEQSPEYAWLIEHCTEYGFILRYPKDKEAITGVTYEPWHYRYVGVEDAKRITQSGLCLEEYVA